MLICIEYINFTNLKTLTINYRFPHFHTAVFNIYYSFFKIIILYLLLGLGITGKS